MTILEVALVILTYLAIMLVMHLDLRARRRKIQEYDNKKKAELKAYCRAMDDYFKQERAEHKKRGGNA